LYGKDSEKSSFQLVEFAPEVDVSSIASPNPNVVDFFSEYIL